MEGGGRDQAPDNIDSGDNHVGVVSLQPHAPFTTENSLSPAEKETSPSRGPW